MSGTASAKACFIESGILYIPGKAANAGGVAVSALEMSRNPLMLSRDFNKVDEMLRGIMRGIYNNISSTAKEFGCKGNFVAGANLYSFTKVAQTMLIQVEV